MTKFTTEQRDALCTTYERLLDLLDMAEGKGVYIIHNISTLDRGNIQITLIIYDAKHTSIDYYKSTGSLLDGTAVQMLNEAAEVLNNLDSERQRMISECEAMLAALKG